MTRFIDKQLFSGAFASLAVLLAASLLYPISFSNLFVNFGLFHANAIGALLIFCAPLMVLYFWLNKKKIDFRRFDIILIVTMVFIAVRGVIAAAEWGEGIGMVIYYVGYASVLYYSAAVLGQKNNGVLKIIYLIAAIGAIVVAYTFLEFYFRRNVFFEAILIDVATPGRNYYRGGSTLGQPVWLGLFLVQLAPLFILFYFTVKRRIIMIVSGALVAATAIALEITFSKGAWGTAIILTLVGLWHVRRKAELRRPTIILMSSVILAVAIFSIFFTSDVQNGLFSNSRQSETVRPRLYMWERAPAVFLSHPLVGVGLSQGAKEISLREGQEQVKNQPTSIDNLYLTLLTEQGLTGSILVCATLMLIGLEAWKLIRGRGEFSVYAIAITAGLIAVLIDGLTFNSLFSWPNMVIFFVSAGLLRSMVDSEQKNPKKTIHD